MEQFNVILKDYTNWKLDNIETIEALKHHRSLLYNRLEPVYLVLNKLYDDAVEQGGLAEEKETIFQVGLNYLHDQFVVIRIYYEKLFGSDCEAFETYTPLLGYLLFIADFREDLEERDTRFDDRELNDIEILIENMIAERRQEFDYVAARLQAATKKIIDDLDVDYVSILDIFAEIAINLGVELSAERTLVIGEDV